MENLVNSISSAMLTSRRQKLRSYIQEEHKQILKRINEQASYVLRMRKTKFNSEVYREVSESFDLFKISCQNIMDTYFPLLIDPSFLALQSEQELIDKISTLKTIIERNGSSLTKKLTRPKQELEKDKKIKKSRRKGKNCKIPMESTSIMQKWLLENFKDPYPSYNKKIEMARDSRLSVGQVNNWFINARERVIKKFLKKDPKEYQKPLREQISESF